MTLQEVARDFVIVGGLPADNILDCPYCWERVYEQVKPGTTKKAVLRWLRIMEGLC